VRYVSDVGILLKNKVFLILDKRKTTEINSVVLMEYLNTVIYIVKPKRQYV